MEERAGIIFEADEVDARLSSLGLERQVCEDAVRQGELQRRLASPLDPPAAPGFSAWSRTVRALREALVPRGWDAEDNGISTVVNPARTVAIAVATGDGSTGKPGPPPRTKQPRGPATIAAVHRNQMSLFELFDPSAAESPISSRTPTTWLLLCRSSPSGLMAEVSCPDAIGNDDRVVAWSERILLGAIERGTDLGRVDVPARPQPHKPIDVTVSRRLA
jgi:hypothetical protein